MEPSSTQARISPVWLLLDIVGIALTGVGAALNTGHQDVLPVFMRFPGAGWVAMAAGILLMLPLVWQIRRRVRHIQQQDARRLLELGIRMRDRR